MTDEVSIRVNFSRAMPVFPLDSVVLLPQQVMPLHVFEPRYRQMVGAALDSVGQIAMGTFEGQSWKQEYHGSPPLRPAVCVGQIVQHEKLPDGRYNILLQGVCRAKVVDEVPPDGERLFREAVLEPVGVDEGADTTPGAETLRQWIDDALGEGPLSRLIVSDQVRKYVENDEVPTPALLELVAFAMLNDPAVRYRLLEEGALERRCELIRAGLDDLVSLIRKADAQHPEEWPKGLSWN
ncbi:MAG: LON peptidase substrate-binding domain-containing protein [Planctomycetota bacterium]